jgi:hypothetical protein
MRVSLPVNRTIKHRVNGAPEVQRPAGFMTGFVMNVDYDSTENWKRSGMIADDEESRDVEPGTCPDRDGRAAPHDQ